MNFTITHIQGLIHLNFKDQKTLCRYMVRIEEFYESPEFAGKYFELADYIKWYAKENGSWSYYSDWSGFNIPGNKVVEFINLFPKLRSCEKEILAQLPSTPNYYLIATYGEDNEDIISHEMVHSKFYLDSAYKEMMTNLVMRFRSELESLEKWILKSYNESVLLDELQAYACTARPEFFESKGIEVDQAVVDVFKKAYQDYKSQI